MIPTHLMIRAAKAAPTKGPMIGIGAYRQSELPLAGIGRTACATRGAKSRAGLMAYPVGPPRLNPMTQTSTPQNHGLKPGARPVGPSDLLPKLKPATIKQAVAIISGSNFAGNFRIAAAVQNTASLEPVSGVSLQFGRQTVQASTAPPN